MGQSFTTSDARAWIEECKEVSELPIAEQFVYGMGAYDSLCALSSKLSREGERFIQEGNVSDALLVAQIVVNIDRAREAVTNTLSTLGLDLPKIAQDYGNAVAKENAVGV